MKKVLLIFLCFYLYGSNVKLRRMYVNELLNYTVSLPKEIYDPFIVDQNNSEKNKTISLNKQLNDLNVTKKQKLSLLSMLNNTVLLKLDDQIRWVKEGDKIGNFTILKIYPMNNKVKILFNKKIEVLNLKQNNNINIITKVRK